MPGSPAEAPGIGAAITRKSGSNLALSFMCLNAQKRAAMSTFYAYCRVADDIVDQTDVSNEAKAVQIAQWREEIKACYLGEPSTELGRELAAVVKAYLIPPEPLLDILDGVEMDITQSRYATFADLERYCYRVASAVGLVSINIFEYRNPLAREYAVALGMAFQLTNILRDVKYDLVEYGRIYLPQDEMARYGVTEDDLRSEKQSEGCSRLFRQQFFRARHFFNKAARLLPAEDRDNMQAALIMTEVYHDLLMKLHRHKFQILARPVKLNRLQKFLSITRAQRKRGQDPQPKIRPRRIAVWGGGFAGLSAAIDLASKGHHVELFEAKSYLGGRAHSFKESKTGLTLDNGQHVLMGCYHSCMDFIRLLGVESKLEKQSVISVPYQSESGGSTTFQAANLPAPFHLLAALFRFGELKTQDRLAILYLGFRLRLGHRPKTGMTAEAWLKKLDQTPGAIRALWEPFCVAALNEPLHTASAVLLEETMRRSFFGGREDASIYVSRVGLSDLFMPEAAWYLESVGGKIHSGEGIQSLIFNGDAVSGFVTTKQRELRFDSFVSALPASALQSLLPGDHPFTGQIRSIPTAPIIAVHLFCDGPIMDRPFIGLLDSPVHWIFDRTRHLENRETGTHLFSCVVSAAYDLMPLGGPNLVQKIRAELARLFPESRHVKIVHHVVYKSRDATFAAQPDVLKLRPGTVSPWKNLYLAGDWIDTGLPATLESAVASAMMVAPALDLPASA